MFPDMAFIVNLIEKKLTGARVINIKPFQKMYKTTSDFIYQSDVVYFGLFNITYNGLFALSLTNTMHYETILNQGITNSFLFDRLNAINVVFIGYRITVKQFDYNIPSPADFNHDFNNDFYV